MNRKHSVSKKLSILFLLLITISCFLFTCDNTFVNNLMPLKVQEEDNTLTITLHDDNCGIAVSSAEMVQAGDEVTITALPDYGYRFKEWKILSGDIQIEDTKESPAAFTMTETSVSIMATFVSVNLTASTAS